MQTNGLSCISTMVIPAQGTNWAVATIEPGIESPSLHLPGRSVNLQIGGSVQTNCLSCIFTVVIFASGTNWAVAAMRAFFLIEEPCGELPMAPQPHVWIGGSVAWQIGVASPSGRDLLLLLVQAS